MIRPQIYPSTSFLMLRAWWNCQEQNISVLGWENGFFCILPAAQFSNELSMHMSHFPCVWLGVYFITATDSAVNMQNASSGWNKICTAPIS